MGRRIDRESYKSDFQIGKSHSRRQKAALERAWETRNFEIGLYWKRATYFWTIIGVLFAGYALVASRVAEVAAQPAQLAPLISLKVALACVGLVLSAAWYLVNRGSSAWQRNWEAHVDALEDEITGPIYKTVRDTSDYRLHHWLGPLNVSPSKVTVAVSLFVALMWAGLLVASLPVGWWPFRFGPPGPEGLIAFSLVLTIIALMLLAFGKAFRTRTDDDPLRFRRRDSDWD